MPWRVVDVDVVVPNVRAQEEAHVAQLAQGGFVDESAAGNQDVGLGNLPGHRAIWFAQGPLNELDGRASQGGKDTICEAKICSARGRDAGSRAAPELRPGLQVSHGAPRILQNHWPLALETPYP